MGIGDLSVGGSVKLKGPVKLGTLSIAGSLSVEGDLETDVLEVSGSARITGVLRSGRITVSGSLTVEKNVEAGKIEVSGSLSVSEKVEAENLSVSGSLKAGEARANRLEIYGMARGGSFKGREVEVGRKSEVHGLMVGCNVVVARNASVDRVVGKQVRIGRGAEVDYLEAEEAVVEDSATVGVLVYVVKAELSDKSRVGELRKTDKLSIALDCNV
ncbi:polymer-forming cytoskeletal protein [Thermosphaera chiliense]|uniref:Polymer-forming cytoskeletal protein n=1 Tax=Thermosphaera chiliense TaxID=3402707 RepID=A0A7M1UUW2_9CREN|nr:polymer-forming cytoskeletal protein [Thermosphaera aggregans]QOR94904.1 polymer-forming cytoskeletal protein [Thermosphaera aggregans]